MRIAVTADPARGPQIAGHRYRLAISGQLPEEEFGHEPYVLEELFDAARAGIYGTYGDALRELAAYLERQARQP